MDKEEPEKCAIPYFDRSLETAILKGYWKKHPTFEKYCSYINYPNVEWCNEKFRNIFPYSSGHIDIGLSYWEPKKQLHQK